MQTVFAKCKIERGGFSSERTFEITLRDGHKLVGTAHVGYLFDENHEPLDDDTPGFGEAIDGFVECRVVRQIDPETIVIDLPSADVARVSPKLLTPS